MKNISLKMEDVDRISDLPDAILSCILSSLSTREAVETSVLSSRWRYLFNFVSNVDFNLRKELCGKKINLDDESFRSLVDRMLSSDNETNVDKFCLKGFIKVDSRCLYGWIYAAFQRGLKYLDLDVFTSKNLDPFPDILFSCGTLRTLKLDMHMELDASKVFRFPNLKTLHLSGVVVLNADSAQTLLSGCTSLEEMVITSCHPMENKFNISHHLLKRLTIDNFSVHCLFTINSPNLAYFKYMGYGVARFSPENLQSLVKADVHIIECLQPDPTEFFRSLSKVHSLIISYRSLKVLLRCKPIPVFAAMVKLKMSSTSWSNSFGQKLGTLLSNSPELEELDISQYLLSSLPEEVPSCLLFKLKRIEISNFRDNNDCIGKARYVLKNGGALEKLIIRTTSNVSYSKEEKSKMCEVLLASPRKSNECCIFII